MMANTSGLVIGEMSGVDQGQTIGLLQLAVVFRKQTELQGWLIMKRLAKEWQKAGIVSTDTPALFPAGARGQGHGFLGVVQLHLRLMYKLKTASTTTTRFSAQTHIFQVIKVLIRLGPPGLTGLGGLIQVAL